VLILSARANDAGWRMKTANYVAVHHNPHVRRFIYTMAMASLSLVRPTTAEHIANK
jgi:hypothetical protein